MRPTRLFLYFLNGWTTTDIVIALGGSGVLDTSVIFGTSLLQEFVLWQQILVLVGIFIGGFINFAILLRILRNVSGSTEKSRPSQHAESEVGGIQQAHRG